MVEVTRGLSACHAGGVLHETLGLLEEVWHSGVSMRKRMTFSSPDARLVSPWYLSYSRPPRNTPHPTNRTAKLSPIGRLAVRLANGQLGLTWTLSSLTTH